MKKLALTFAVAAALVAPAAALAHHDHVSAQGFCTTASPGLPCPPQAIVPPPVR